MSLTCVGVVVYVQNGASALLMASEQGHLNIVKILLQHHARVDVFDEVSSLITVTNRRLKRVDF